MDHYQFKNKISVSHSKIFYLKVSIFLIIFNILFLYLRLKAEIIENEYRFKKSDPKYFSISDITNEQAERLINAILNEKKIPYGYPYEGCMYRATAFARFAEFKKDIIVGKIIVEGKLAPPYIGDLNKLGYKTWHWHVANVVSIVQNDGSKKLMVIDPPFFNKPVEIESWKESLTSNKIYDPYISKLYFGDRHQFYPLFAEELTYEEDYNKLDIKNLKKEVKKMLREQDKNIIPNSSNDIFVTSIGTNNSK